MADFQSLSPVLDELLGGINEWRSVPDVIRLTFKALSDVVKAQGSALKEIQQDLNEKPSNSEVRMAISAVDILEELKSIIDSKVSYPDFEDFLKDKVSKAEVMNLLQNKISYVEFRSKQEEYDEKIFKIQEEIEELNKKSYRGYSNEEINKIYGVLDTKANRADILEILEQKANKNMIEALLNQKMDTFDLELLMETKADLSKVETLKKEIDEKAIKDDISRLRLSIQQELSNFPRKEDLENEMEKSRHLLDEIHLRNLQMMKDWDLSIREQVDRKAENWRVEILAEELKNKPDTIEFDNILDKLKTESSILKESINNNVLKLEEKYKSLKIEVDILSQKCSFVSNQIGEIENERINSSQQNPNTSLKNTGKNDKIGLNKDKVKKLFTKWTKEALSDIKLENQAESNNILAKTNDEINSLKQELGKISKRFHKLSKLHENIKEINKLLDEKVSASNLEQILSTKTDLKYLTQIVSNQEEISKSIEKIHKILDTKCDSKSFENHLNTCEDLMDLMNKDLMLKANIKDVLTLLDEKTNEEDFKLEMTIMKKELENMVVLEEFNLNLANQNSINEALYSENCLARWLWKSGNLKDEAAIWEIQCNNTCPGNFIWEENCTDIETVAPGLYELVYGFYSQSRPSISIFVNNEIILKDQKPSELEWLLHSDGNIAGVSKIEYIALPARARVKIHYSNEDRGEGFLGLRKL